MGLVFLAVLLFQAPFATGQGWGTGLLDPGVSRPILVRSVKASYTAEVSVLKT